MPFSTYMHPNEQLSTSHTACSSLSLFLTMPFDIQLLVYQACDPSTLYALMRASSAFRIEAARAFWSHPSPWYQTPCKWLTFEYGRPGSESHCVKFARCVQQVEVQFRNMTDAFWSFPRNSPNRRNRRNPEEASWLHSSVEEQVHDFWNGFQRNFPAARHVVLSGKGSIRAEFLPDTFAVVARKCPPEISLSIAVLHKSHYGEDLRAAKKHTHLYKLEESPSKKWLLKLVESHWHRDRIMLPPKIFSGHVGMFQNYLWKSHLVENRFQAIRLAHIAVHEDIYFGEGRIIPFSCLAWPVCKARILKKGEWQEHLSHNIHDQYRELTQTIEGQSCFRASEFFPSEVNAYLKEEERRNYEKYKLVLIRRSELLRLASSAKREQFDQRFRDDIRNNPLYRHHAHTRYCSTYLEWKNFSTSET
jgi:hypothetical protein